MASRRAFTLVELMIASSIAVLVVGGAIGALVGIQRMAKTAMAESELAVDMRLKREKLLLHQFPAADGQTSYGLLSTVDPSNTFYFVELTDSMNGIERQERVAIPVFGVEQKIAGGAFSE